MRGSRRSDESNLLVGQFQRLALPLRLLLTVLAWGVLAAVITAVSLLTGRISLNVPLFVAVLAISFVWVLADHFDRRW